MKNIRAISFSLIALGLIVSAGIFLGAFYANAHLPQITRQASKIVGRPVTIGHAALGFSLEGITLDIGPLVIADDAAVSHQPFAKIDRVRLGLDVASLINHRKIRITSVLLQSPEIHIILSQEGILNVRSIGVISLAVGHKGSLGRDPGAGIISLPLEVKPVPNAVMPVLSIRSIKIRDASICFIDQNETFPLDIWVSDINASIDGFSQTKPFRLSLEASTCSNVPNVRLSAVLSLTGKGISISDLTFHTDLSQLDLNKAKGISPVLSHISSPASVTGSGVPTHITGIVSIHLTNLEIGAPGVLTASGEAALTDCVIEHFNIVKEVLFYTLGTIPGLFEVAGNFFNGVLNNKLGGDNTIIEKARAQFSIQKHTLFIKDSLVQTKAFDFTANGSVDGGLNTSLQTMLRLNEDVSASLKDKVNMLGSLMGDDKRIAIPARLSGVFPHLEYKPDKEFRKKAKKAFMKEGPKQIINDVLKNLLQ